MGERRGEEKGFLGGLSLSLSRSLISADDDREARLQFSKRENQIETKGLAWIWIVAYCMGEARCILL